MEALEVGHRVLIDDGKIMVIVREKGDGWVDTEVMNDASISSRKGFNLPDTYVDGAAMTPKDINDLEFCLKNIDFDWVALSFVQKQEDILQLRDMMGDHKGKVLAKIEKPSAIDNLKSITDVCDGIMVARGDLGVEMQPEDVPMLQKEIIDECRSQGKPVIVATQMLESMMDNPAPTRAECSDIATAIFDGADAVMLSGESAAGKYPVESVAMQQKVISRVENDPKWQERSRPEPITDGTYPDAAMASATTLAQALKSKAFVVVSKSGASVNRATRMRPGIPIIAITPNESTNRALALQKHVYPVTLDPTKFSSQGLYSEIWEIAKSYGFVADDKDTVVLAMSEPFGLPANTIKVITKETLEA
jgi:pyruvate kinase